MAKDAENLYLEFTHEGELPGLAEIELYAGDSFKDGQFPAVTVNKTDSTKKTPVKPTTKTTAKTAKTGDNTPVEGLLLLAGISAAAMILIGKSRKKI